jgi:predicted ester cyclase
MASEQNKAIVRRFYKAFEDNNLEALKEILTPDLVAYNLNPQNRDEHIQGVRTWHEAFSENRFEILDQIAEGDLVASQVVMRCIHNKASFQGVSPSGKVLEIPALTLEKIRDGKIVERWVYSDRLGMLGQLGITQTPVSAK